MSAQPRGRGNNCGRGNRGGGGNRGRNQSRRNETDNKIDQTGILGPNPQGQYPPQYTQGQCPPQYSQSSGPEYHFDQGHINQHGTYTGRQAPQYHQGQAPYHQNPPTTANYQEHNLHGPQDGDGPRSGGPRRQCGPRGGGTYGCPGEGRGGKGCSSNFDRGSTASSDGCQIGGDMGSLNREARSRGNRIAFQIGRNRGSRGRDMWMGEEVKVDGRGSGRDRGRFRGRGRDRGGFTGRGRDRGGFRGRGRDSGGFRGSSRGQPSGRSNLDKEVSRSVSSLGSAADLWEDEAGQEDDLQTIIRAVTENYLKKKVVGVSGIEIDEDGNACQTPRSNQCHPEVRVRCEGKYGKGSDHGRKNPRRSAGRTRQKSIQGEVEEIEDAHRTEDVEDEIEDDTNGYDSESDLKETTIKRKGLARNSTRKNKFMTGKLSKVGKGKSARSGTSTVSSIFDSLKLKCPDTLNVSSEIGDFLKVLEGVSKNYGTSSIEDVLETVGKPEITEEEEEEEDGEKRKRRRRKKLEGKVPVKVRNNSSGCSSLKGSTETVKVDKDDVEDEDIVQAAFKTLLSKFGGRAKMTELEKEKSLFPEIFFDKKWLRNKKKFILFQKSGVVEYVSVYFREAKLCVFHNDLKGCTNTPCDYFHVCRGFITETCKPHLGKCSRPHNFFEKDNAILLKKLGLTSFKNKEIAKMLRLSVPEACPKYNQDQLHEEACPFLHVCNQHPCKKKPVCNLEHNCLSSEHNTWVLGCFHMAHYKEYNLARLVLGRNNPHIGDRATLKGSGQGNSKKDSTGSHKRTEEADKSPLATNLISFDEEVPTKLPPGPHLLDEPIADISQHSSGKCPYSLTEGYPIQKTPFGSEAKLTLPGFEHLGIGSCVSGLPAYEDSQHMIDDVADYRKNYKNDSRMDEAGAMIDDEIEYRRSYLQRKNASGFTSQTAASPDQREVFVPVSSGFAQSEDTAPGKQYLCEQHVWKTCTDITCPYIHGNSKLPYEWQFDLNGNWQNFSNDANFEVEKSFCQLEGMVAGLEATGGLKAAVNLDRMTANIYQANQVVSSGVTVRRLSTRSYVQGEGDLSHLTSWCWYWQGGDGPSWILYEPPRLQYSLEEKFLFRQPDYYFQHGDFQYKITFDSTGMSQDNLRTKTRRSVCRRPILVSEKDVSENCVIYHPGLVLQSLPKIADIPEHWTPVDHVQPFEVVSVTEDSKLYSQIKDKFFAQGGLNEARYPIVGIFQVQNPSLWSRHRILKQTMENNAQREGISSKVDERFLFHGTDSLKVVHGICQNGIDPRMHGKHGVLYGKGAYFATSSQYSNEYTGHGSKKYMFYARVLVGQFIIGTEDLKRPPERKGNILYDSCVNNMKNPSKFVIFDTHQSYPEFLIEYRDTSKDTASSLAARQPRSSMAAAATPSLVGESSISGRPSPAGLPTSYFMSPMTPSAKPQPTAQATPVSIQPCTGQDTKSYHGRVDAATIYSRTHKGVDWAPAGAMTDTTLSPKDKQDKCVVM